MQFLFVACPDFTAALVRRLWTILPEDKFKTGLVSVSPEEEDTGIVYHNRGHTLVLIEDHVEKRAIVIEAQSGHSGCPIVLEVVESLDFGSINNAAKTLVLEQHPNVILPGEILATNTRIVSEERFLPPSLVK